MGDILSLCLIQSSEILNLPVSNLYSSTARGVSTNLNVSLSLPDLNEDSDSDMETDLEPTSPIGVTPKFPRTPRHDLMLTEETRSRSSFFKQTKSFPMFVYHESKPKWDDYGEIIRPEDYMKEDNDRFAVQIPS